MKRYRLELIGAYLAKVDLHPQLIIMWLAPDAFDLEPVPVADAWLFRTTSPIDPLPGFVVDISCHTDRPGGTDD